MLKYGGKAITFIILFIIGTLIRILFIPNSSGPDIPQFYAFARTFDEERLCFYLYADVGKDYWPYNWEYCYPPLWLIYLFTSYKLLGNSTIVYKLDSIYKVNTAWITMVKLPLLLSDIIIALLIIHYFKGIKGLISSLAWYLNPAVIYVSSIFGMFDQIVALFIIIAVIFYEKDKLFLSSFSSAIAILLKQYALLPVSFLFLHSLIYKGRNATAKLIFTSIIVILAFILPFILLCKEPFKAMWKIISLIIFTRSAPYYPKPYCYNFNGITSLLTWLHDIYGLNTVVYFKFWIVILAILLLPILLIVTGRKIGNIWTMMFLSFNCFIIALWRVNYQYLIVLIALGILTYLTERRVWINRAALLLALFPAIWFFMFPYSFWFHYYIPNPNTQLIAILDTYSLRIYIDEVYITYSIILTMLLIITYTIIIVLYAKEKKKE